MKLLASLCGLMGLALVANGLWIPAKAALAQTLIEQAWLESRDTNRVVKPWPWMDTWPVARLVVPRLGISLVALEGASGQALAFGPGLQVPDTDSRTVLIAGHNDTHFRFLEDLEAGDVFELEQQQAMQRYRVTGSEIVDVRNGPLVVSGPEKVLLVTCYPFDLTATNGPLRYVVTAVKEGA